MSRTLKLIPMLMAILLFASFTSNVMALTTPIYVDQDATAGNGTTAALTGANAAVNTIVAAYALVSAGGTIIVAPNTDPYSEVLPLTINKALTIKKGTGTGSVIIDGDGTNNVVFDITTVNPVTLQGLTIRPQGQTSATNLIQVVASTTETNFKNCSFTLLEDAANNTTTYIYNTINYLGVATKVTIENCSFNMTYKTNAVGVKFTTGAVSNVDIYGSTFTGSTGKNAMAVKVMDTVVSDAAGIDEFEFSGNTCSFAQVTFFVNKLDVSPGGATSGIGNARFYGNRFEGGNGILIKTIATGTDTWEIPAPYVATPAGGTAGPKIPLASKQILIKGNHFGSASTDGDTKYAIFFYGLDAAVDLFENQIFIQYNNFQYPQTGAALTGPNTAHVSVVDGVGTAASIDAQYNWWGSVNGPITSPASGSIAIVNTSFTSTNYIGSYNQPKLDDVNKGVEYYDFDQNGQIDRCVVWFDNYLDPATVANTDFSVAGYTFDTTKAARIAMDNDNSGAPDSPMSLTIFLSEKTTTDTGTTPTLMFTSPSSGGLTGITGNSSAKVSSFTASGASLHDKAFPVVKTVTTGDTDKDGKLDQLIVVYSEAMKALTSSQWISGFTGGAGAFQLQYKWDTPVGGNPTGTTGYTATSASQVSDTITYTLTETTDTDFPYDTGNTPDFVYTTNNTAMDLALNELATFTETAVDGAAPVAFKVGTEDANNTGSGTVAPSGAADGYLDGISIYFSEEVVAAANTSGDYTGSYNFLYDLAVTTVENSINIARRATANAVATKVTGTGNTTNYTNNILFVEGFSGKEVEKTSLHPWNTDAIPTVTYTNTLGGVVDANEGLAWVYFTTGTTPGVTSITATDTAAPIITEAFGEVGTTNMYITFSEPVYTDNEKKPITDLAADLLYTNGYNTGTNATSFATTGAIIDGDASDAKIQLKMNAVFAAGDVDAGDQVNAVASALQDGTGTTTPTVTQGNYVPTTAVNLTLYDVTAPTVKYMRTRDFDSDGLIDHIEIEFTESVNDQLLAGYVDGAKLSTGASAFWSVEGYTVVGLNFVGSTAEQTTATTDAATNHPTAAKDERGKVINVSDTSNDAKLYLMVEEKTATLGDTAAKPPTGIVGSTDAGSKVKDLKQNKLVTVTGLVPLDFAGPAITKAVLNSETEMDIWFSETLHPLQTFAQTGGNPNFNGGFSLLVGSNAANFTGAIKDVEAMTVAGVVNYRLTLTSAITAGNSAKIALTASTVQDANMYSLDYLWNGQTGSKLTVIPNFNTQNSGNVTFTYTAATGVEAGTGVKSYVAATVFTPADIVAGDVGAPADLVLTDVPNDNGHWMFATFTVSADHLTRVKSYQFYREVDFGTATAPALKWVYSAVVPAGVKDANNQMVCLVPSIVNGVSRWAVVASTGDVVTDLSVAAKEAGMAVGMVVDAAQKAAADVVLSAVSAIAEGGAIDNIAPSAIVTFNAAANAGEGVLLTWVAPADHGIVGSYGWAGVGTFPIYGVDEYQVYRKVMGATGDFALVGSAAPLSTSYVDAVANSSTIYSYMIKAVDSAHSVATTTKNAMAFVGGSDFTSDGVVGLGDLVLFGNQWGSVSTDANWVSAFDLNADGTVGLGDLVLLGNNWTVASKVAKEALPLINDVALTMSASYDGSSSIYYVNVAANKVDGFNGIGLTMSYDADALELVKDGITGLGAVSITREAEAGMVDINSYFMDKEFTGTVTVAFKSKGMSKNFDFALVNASVSIDNVISAVSKLASVTVQAVPTVYSINQNFPNPFNPTTTIEYSIPQAGNVNLVIYNMAGQKVRTLVNENQPASYKKVVWDGRNDMGETVGAGLYFYKLVSGNFSKIQKMTLIK